MRVLITGATGFAGLHLAKGLIERGHAVAGIARLWHQESLSADIAPKFPVYQGDVAWSHEFVEGAIAAHRPDAVIHLAAQTEVGAAVNDPSGTFRSNITGTWNVLEACRRQKVTRLVVGSTDKSYGWTPPPYKESDPVRASAPYETSKACADLLAQCYEKTYDMNVAVTRAGNYYGPGRLNWSTLIPMTIRSITEKRKPILRSDGTFKRDFLFIEDGVEAYIKLLESNERGPFNFGTGNPSRVIDVVTLICDMMGWKGGITIIDEAKHEIVDQYLNIERARTVLGWTPTHTLEAGLAKTIPWYVRHLEGKP